MKNFWTIIKGLLFIPPTSFEILKTFFISTFRVKLVHHKNDFDKFLSYLSKLFESLDEIFALNPVKFYKFERFSLLFEYHESDRIH